MYKLRQIYVEALMKFHWNILITVWVIGSDQIQTNTNKHS